MTAGFADEPVPDTDAFADRRDVAAERERIRELVAVLAEWVEHLPQRHVPLRAGFALAELQRLTGATEGK